MVTYYLTGLLLAGCCCLAFPYIVERGSDSPVCETLQCSDAAESILSLMDTEANPCNNFYQYACGGWTKSHPIPENSPTYGQFRLASERNLRRLQELLSTDYSQDRSAIKKAKKFYKSCMDEEATEELGPRRLLDLIAEMGGMPLFDGQHQHPPFNLERFLAATKTSKRAEESALIQISVRVDDMNCSRHVITLDQPSLIMPNRMNYLSSWFNSTRDAYSQFLRRYLAELWISMDQARGRRTFSDDALNQAVQEILELETELAKIIVPEDQRNDISKFYHKMTVEQLSLQLSSEFNWLEYINGIMRKVEIEVDSTTEVVLNSKGYLRMMMTVLRKYNERKIRNYIVTRKAVTLIDLLPKKFRDTSAIYRRAIKGITKENPRWQDCSQKTNELMPMAVGAIYAKEVFPKQSKATVLETIDNVITSFKENLQRITWMDEETKRRAVVKVDNVNQLIGYPDYVLDEEDSSLDEKYEGVEILENQYFLNEIKIQSLQFRESLRVFDEAVDRKSWGIPPARVNAYYQPNFNNILFPAGILQQPFFDAVKPFAMNYGSIGSIAGHEISHGFDTSGSRYNHDGNLENWWTNTSRTNFEKETQCLKTQYSRFYDEVAGMYMNGNLTIAENIADNGGIRSAYDAYQLWKGLNPGMEFQLPGLEHFSLEQLFFVSNAQVWCSSRRAEYARQMAMKSRHAPVKFRIEGTFRNFEKFGEAFKCRRGEDELYPDPNETCRIW